MAESAQAPGNRTPAVGRHDRTASWWPLRGTACVVRRGLVALLVPLFVTGGSVPLHAQSRIFIRGDRLTGIVLPVEPVVGPIEMRALRATVWTVDDTQRLWLDQDVEILIGDQRFTAPSAVVWINRIPSAIGLINQVALYFEQLENPTSRAGLSVAGRDILVTGSALGAVTLSTSLDELGPPRTSDLQRRAEKRLAEYLRRVVGEPQTLTDRPQVYRPPPPHVFTPVPGGTVEAEDYVLPKTAPLPDTRDERPWLRNPEAVVRASFGTLHVVPGEHENVITLTDSVVVEYFAQGGGEDLSHLTLIADRAVIFLAPGSLEEMAEWEMDVSRIRGIYLEGNVTASANEGDYTLRSPRMYYDFTTGQALMADAILRTYDRDIGVPVYSRAEEMRQIAENQWEGRRVRVTTSEFYTGHLSLGSSRMTVTRRPVRGDAPDGERGTYLDARDVTLRVGDLPFFYWPRFAGRVQEIPLREIRVGAENNVGLAIETGWDLFSLLGIDRPDGVDAELQLDGFTERGPAAGLLLNYDVGDAHGTVDLYGLHDDGTDLTSAGEEVPQDGTWRGITTFEHQQALAPDWTLQAQVAWISDPSFVTTWRESDFATRREYETSVYFKDQKERSALTLLGKYDLTDFVSTGWLLASEQYTVDRTPDIAYRRLGDALFNDAVTYTGDIRYSRVEFSFVKSTPEELGVPEAAVGVPSDVPVEDRFIAAGYPTRAVHRFDTRHEFAVPDQWGILGVTPFFVGRVTAWDDDFESFSGNEDKVRLFGAAGLRLNTQFQRVHDGVENELLDLHRLRHIVEPSATLWYGAANIDQDKLPVYDLNVESIATGAAARLGVRNVLQTQRGGPGRWRSVDVLTVDADLVLNSDDGDRESPTPQFFDYRPEYSQFGSHVFTSLVWLLSDALAISGQGTYDLDDSLIARGSIGAELRHSPLLSTFVEYRYINASENELLGIGWNYKLTPKYRISIVPQWDFRNDDFRAVNLQIIRSFPDFELTLRIRRDEIKDDTSFGASIGLVEF